MKVLCVTPNNHRRIFEVALPKGTLPFPYAKLDPEPTRSDPIVDIYVDAELAREGFTYTLASGAEGSVLADQVLDYNMDPDYMREMLLYRLTVDAQERVRSSRISKREIARRLRTSPSQLIRLLDQTNYRKSVDSMLALLHVLGCDVDLVVRD